MSKEKTKLTLANRYQESPVSDELIDQWIKADQNVLLIGERGTGKTERVLAGFARNFKNYAFYSGATMDPWTDLIGIPRVGQSTKNQDEEVIKYVRPEEIDDTIEAFFIDEFNRSKLAVQNALMELIQFKTINGRKFPNLKVVWAAINPPPSADDDEEEFYNVGHIDPAQLDRFHMIVRVPTGPCSKFFTKKFGKTEGSALVSWWNKLPLDAKKNVSPRRLQYVGDAFKKGLDIKYLLPINCQVDDLLRALSYNSDDLALFNFQQNPSAASLKAFIKGDDSRWEKYKAEILKNDANQSFIAGSIPSECYATLISENENFKKYQCALYVNGYTNVKRELDKITSVDRKGELKKLLEGVDFAYGNNPYSVFDAHKDSYYSFCSKSNMTFTEYVEDIQPSLKPLIQGEGVKLGVAQMQKILNDMLPSLVEGSWDYRGEKDRLLVADALDSILELKQLSIQGSAKDISIIYNTAAMFVEGHEKDTIESLKSIYKTFEADAKLSKLFIPPSKFIKPLRRLSANYLESWEKLKTMLSDKA